MRKPLKLWRTTSVAAAANLGGFSLIEVIIVMALIAFIYTVAMPQFNMRSGAETATKLNGIAGDIRGAFDLAVLTGKPYRLVIQFNSGDYWLEETDKSNFGLSSDKIDRDPGEQEEKDEASAFDSKFNDYRDLAGVTVADPKSGKEIPPESPVLTAKRLLKRAQWSRVDSLEWSHRSIGPHMMVKSMQAEHHGHKQDLSEIGPEARGMIYFFPSGYVERAVIYIYIKKDDLVPDETQEPYTIVTNPYEGVAEVIPGYQDYDVQQDKID